MLKKYTYSVVSLMVILLFGVLPGIQAAPVDPSFELVRGVPETCSAEAGEELRFEVIANVSFGSGSNRGELRVDAATRVGGFTGNHNQPQDYPVTGDGFYDFIVEETYSVPAGTPVTAEIITYSGLDQTGQEVYRSTLTYNCESGEVLSLENFNLLDDPNAQSVDELAIPPVNPAFELTQGIPDTCSVEADEELRFDTRNNVSFGSGSNQGTLSVQGVGQVASFAGNHNQPQDYPSVGNGFYDFIIETAYDVPDGRTITAEITTYSGLNQTGQAVYRSTLVYSCDIGEVIRVENENLIGDTAAPPQTGIPPVDPAFELTQGVSDTCSATIGERIRFDTLNNVSFGSGSNQATFQVRGEGVIDTVAGNHTQPQDYPSIGDGFYEFVIGDAYRVPAGTIVTVEITTFDGLNQTGQTVYRSRISYRCDTGVVTSRANDVLLIGATPAP